MKMKLSEIIGKYNALVEMKNGKIAATSIINRTFPAKLSYGISRNVKKFESEIESYNVEKKKICERLVDKDEEGKAIMIPKENNMQEYSMTKENKEILNQELNDLLDSEIEVEIHMVPENVLSQCEMSDRYHILTAKELCALDFMIEPEK